MAFLRSLNWNDRQIAADKGKVGVIPAKPRNGVVKTDETGIVKRVMHDLKPTDLVTRLQEVFLDGNVRNTKKTAQELSDVYLAAQRVGDWIELLRCAAVSARYDVDVHTGYFAAQEARRILRRIYGEFSAEGRKTNAAYERLALLLKTFPRPKPTILESKPYGRRGPEENFVYPVHFF